MLYQLIKNFRREQGESLYVKMFLSFVELHTVKNGKLFIIMRGDTSPSITVLMVGGQVETNVQYVSYAREAAFTLWIQAVYDNNSLNFYSCKRKLQECDPPEIKYGYIGNF